MEQASIHKTLNNKIPIAYTQMKWQIIPRKIRQVRKTMSKQSKNLCKQVLIEGQSTCGGEVMVVQEILNPMRNTWSRKR